MLKRTTRFDGLALALTLALSQGLIGCGGDDPAEDGGGVSGTTGESTAGTGDTGGTEGGTTDGPDGLQCDQPADEDFLGVFGYRWRVAGVQPPEGKSTFDLFMMRPEQKAEPANLTAFLPEADGLSCEFGCLVDDTLSFIGINAAPPDQDGLFDFQIGLFNDCLDVKLKGLTFEGKSHFAFAGRFIYYSEPASCNGPTCQYKIWRVNLDDPSDTKLLIPLFPPPEDADWKNGDATYKGRFQVSPDGESLVMLSPTIRSQRVYLWRDGTLHEVDYLCDNFQNDSCIGAGSNYTDNDPVAISPDSSQVVLFTVTQRALRVRRYSTSNPNDKGSLTLMSIPPDAGGSFQELACLYRQDWQPTAVSAQPTFSPDGSKLIFVGESECTAGADKKETDIFWMDPSRIDVLKPVEEADLFNVTNNPKDQSPANNVVTGISASPDGGRIFFTATPHLASDWKPIKDSDARHTSDHEVFVVDVCGGVKTQLTSQVSFEGSTPRAMSFPAKVEGCPGHPLNL